MIAWDGWHGQVSGSILVSRLLASAMHGGITSKERPAAVIDDLRKATAEIVDELRKRFGNDVIDKVLGTSRRPCGVAVPIRPRPDPFDRVVLVRAFRRGPRLIAWPAEPTDIVIVAIMFVLLLFLLALECGLDPLNYGFPFVFDLTIATLTVVRMVIQEGSGVETKPCLRDVWPFVWMRYAVLFLCTLFSTMMTWRRRMMGYRAGEPDMARIGMLTPSSNTVLEPVTTRLLAGTPDITAHFSRFRVTEIALDGPALAQFDDSEILRAAELLAHAKVDVMAWNGTSASWLGLDRDRRLVERIRSETGIAASTCILSLVAILRRLGARLQGLVTPYTGDIQEKIMATFAAEGIACPAERHLDLRDNFSFGLVPQAAIRQMISDVASSAPDAVTILCTNLNGASLAADLEAPDGPVILDSVSVTLWGCLNAIGVRPDRIRNQGRIFSDPRLNTVTSPTRDRHDRPANEA